MATLSLTMSQLSPNIKAVHTGIVAVAAAISVSATISPSSIVHMVKVPNHATLLNYWLKISTGGANQTFQIGTSQTPSGIMAVTTLSQTLSISTQPAVGQNYGIFGQGFFVAPGGADLMPVKISLSDDAAPATVWVQGRVGAGCSASAYITFVLFYTMDGMLGHTTIR